MSTTVDNRVVSLQFDNKKFEENASESMSTLDKLKEKLQFKGATKGLEEIDEVVKNTDMSPLGSAVDMVGQKFSMLKVMAFGALLDIGKNAKNAAVNLAKSLSVEQLSEGFKKYGDKTQSVQTIMNATGKSMDDVSKALNRLNWFTDETSYNFTDMVSNVGKFTANNIDLDVAVDAMQGIATWAGISGVNVQEASRAMYNMSQAIGVGAVKLQDWKSIENANMATSKFKETVLETAVAEGELTKVSDGVYRTLKGHEVTVESFNSNLSDAWFTSKVLLKTLDKYGGAATKLNEVMQNLDLDTTSELLDFLDEYKEGTLDIADAAKKAGVSSEEFKSILEELSKEEYALGIEAFRAAQEAKTFQEVIDSVKDAVSTGWMQTFEYIFGNYEEAKRLWTDLANELWEVFNGGAEARNKLFEAWHDDGGRNALVESFWNVFHALTDVVNTVKDAFHDIFPSITAERLVEFTKRLQALTEKFKMTDETTEKLRHTFQGFFAVVSIAKDLFLALWDGTKRIISWFVPLKDSLMNAGDGFGSWLVQLSKTVHDTDLFRNAILALISVVEKAVNVVTGLATKAKNSGIGNAFSAIGDKINSSAKIIGDSFKLLNGTWKKDSSDAEKSSEKTLSAAETVEKAAAIWSNSAGSSVKLETVQEFRQRIIDAAVASGKLVEETEGVYKTMDGTVVSVNDYTQSLSSLGLTSKELTDAMTDCGISVEEAENKMSALDKLSGFQTFLKGISDILSKFSPVINTVSSAAQAAFTRIGGFLSRLASELDWNTIIQLVRTGILGSFAASLSNIAKSFEKTAKKAEETKKSSVGFFQVVKDNITTFTKSLSGMFDNLGGVFKEFKTKIKAEELLLIALSIGILAGALVLLSKSNPEGTVGAIGAITVMVGELMAAMAVFSKIAGKKGVMKLSAVSTALVIFSIAIAVVAGAMKKLAQIGLEGMITAGTGLTVIIGLLIAASKLISKESSGFLKSAISLAIFAIAIRLLVKPIKQLGETNTDVLIKGIAGFSAVLLVMAGILKLMQYIKVTPTAAVPFLLFAVSLRIISEPLQALGKMDWQEILRAVSVVGAVLLEMGLISGLLSKFSGGKSISGALSMLLMAVTIKMIVKPLKELSEFSWGEIARSIVALAGALAVMALVPGLLAKFSAFSIVGVLTLLAMTVVIDRLAEPMKALSTLSWDQIARSVVAMAGALAVMALIPALLTHFSPLAIVGVLTLLAMTEVLKRITTPMLILGSMSWDSVGRALLAMTGAFAVMALVPALLTHFSPLSIVGAFTLIEMSSALVGIAAPMLILGSMSWESIGKAIVAMTVAFAVMALVPALLTHFSPLSIVGALALVEMSKALNEAATPITILGRMSWEQIGTALGAMAGAFVVMAGIPTLLGVFSIATVAGAHALQEVAAALKTALVPMVVLASMSWNDIDRGIQAMLGVLGTLSQATWGVNIFAGIKADATKDLAEALATIVDPLERLSGMDYAEVSRGLDTMKLIFEKLRTVLGGFKFSDLFSGLQANPLLTLSEAIRNLAPALAILAIQNPVAVTLVLTTIANAFKSFGDTLKDSPFFFAKTKAEGIGAMASNVEAIANALPPLMEIKDPNAIRERLEVVSSAFSDFSDVLKETPWFGAKSRAEGIGALIDNVESLTNVLPSIRELGDGTYVKTAMINIGEGFKSFGAALKESPLFGAETKADALAKVVDLLKPMIQALKDFERISNRNSDSNVTSLIESLKTFITGLGDAVSSFPKAGSKVDAFTDVATTLGSVIPDIVPKLSILEKISATKVSDNLVKIADAIVDFCNKVCAEEISIEDFEGAGERVGSAFVNAWIKEVRKRQTHISQLINEVLSDCEAAIRSYRPSMVSAGQYVIDGVAEGIRTSGYNAIRAAKSVAYSVTDITKDVFQERSPSRVFAEIGKNLDIGLANGLEQYAYRATSATKSVAEDAINTANDMINGYSSIFDNDPHMTMTITPVLDLTELYNGRAGFMSAIGGMQDMGVSTSVNLAAQSAAAMNARRNAAEDANAAALNQMNGLIRDLVNNPPSVNNNEFNITNGDPEEVAEEVSQILQRDITRRNAVWQ